MCRCLTLYASKLCFSQFCMLVQQLCTYTANSLCFSSENVSHQAHMMDSLVAGTGRWRKLQGHPLLREAIISKPQPHTMGLHENEPRAMPQCLAFSLWRCRPHTHTHVHASSHIRNEGGSQTIRYWYCPPMLQCLETDLVELLNVWEIQCVSTGLQQEARG